MSIDAKTVCRVAKLARIRLDDTEVEKAAGQLTRIFDWIEQLQEVDTEGVPEMTGVGEYTLRMRDDVVTDGNIQEDILSNAPKSEFGCFVVPKMVE